MKKNRSGKTKKKERGSESEKSDKEGAKKTKLKDHNVSESDN